MRFRIALGQMDDGSVEVVVAATAPMDEDVWSHMVEAALTGTEISITELTVAVDNVDMSALFAPRGLALVHGRVSA